MAIVRGIIVIALMIAAVLGAVTLVALESNEVVVLRTRLPDGQFRRTRVWIVDEGDGSWIEAGNPDREFFGDILREPNVEIERDGKIHPFRAKPLPDAASRDKIRSMLRAKYGWADQWVAGLFDTARSIAIRLEPRSEGKPA